MGLNFVSYCVTPSDPNRTLTDVQSYLKSLANPLINGPPLARVVAAFSTLDGETAACRVTRSGEAA